MASKWMKKSLGELIEIKHGFAFKGEFIHDEPVGDILLTPGNFAIGGGFKGDKFKFYDGPVPDEFVLTRGDLVVTMTDLSKRGDTLGFAAFVPPSRDGRRFLHNQRLGKVVPRNGECVDLRYLHYLMCSQEYRNEVIASATGTTVKHTSPERIKRFQFLLPSRDEQRAIAHILGTLDDKIELNRRMNETLEAMAQALYKSWFVDFDPVRAKAEDRNPGLPKLVADLFPDRFEVSPLGEIPAGWGTKRLGDLLSLEKGLSYKGQFLVDAGVPMVNLGCFLGRGKFDEDAVKGYSGEFQTRHVILPGDLLLANTDITQKREVLGSPALVPPRSDLNKLIFTHHVFAVRFHEGSEPWKIFVYFLLLQESFRDRATGFATGTTVLALPRDAVLDLECPAAPQVLVEVFGARVLPLVQRQWRNAEQTRTLAALRDTSLPKLISGELRVKDAESFLGGPA